jgi:uncharacterized small protein (DUF1192 family)
VSTARFPVVAHLDGAGGVKPGTVEIDREAKTFRVRPKRSHRTYELPLSMVATMVCRQVILGESIERQKAKKAAKKTRAAA